MIRYALAALAVMGLSACGGKSVIQGDMGRMVEASPDSPWLTVDNRGESVLVVTGLEGKPRVQVAPDIATAVQARLRTALQPHYFTDLIINCRDLSVAASVASKDDVPPAASLDLAMSCRIVARGRVVAKGYRVRPSQPVNPEAPQLGTAVPQLIDAAATQVADQLWADVVGTGVRR